MFVQQSTLNSNERAGTVVDQELVYGIGSRHPVNMTRNFKMLETVVPGRRPGTVEHFYVGINDRQHHLHDIPTAQRAAMESKAQALIQTTTAPAPPVVVSNTSTLASTTATTISTTFDGRYS